MDGTYGIRAIDFLYEACLLVSPPNDSPHLLDPENEGEEHQPMSTRGRLHCRNVSPNRAQHAQKCTNRYIVFTLTQSLSSPPKVEELSRSEGHCLLDDDPYCRSADVHVKLLRAVPRRHR